MTEESPKIKQKRLTPEQYERSKLMYRTGKYTLEDLAKEFGVSKTAMFKRFKKDKVKKGENKEFIDEIVKEEVQKQFGDIDFLRENAEKFFEVRTKMLGAIDVFERKQMAIVLKAHQNKENIAIHEDEIRVLGMLAANTNKNINSISKLREVDLDIDLAAAEPEEYVVRVITDSEVADMQREQEEQEREMTDGMPIESLISDIPEDAD
jgi:AcrR family transcriptional regulator